MSVLPMKKAIIQNAEFQQETEAPVWIEIKHLHPHPDNPRLVPRKDVVAALVAQMKATGFDLSHAILVRPLEKGAQIISGHNRVEAAATAGLIRVPAWVRQMDDETAFMELILCNAQGELYPLEKGMHALAATEKGKHNGKSVDAYAKAVGRKKPTVHLEVCAARVAQISTQVDISRLVERTKHLAEIHAITNKACWPSLVTRLVEKKWNVETTKKAVKDVLDVKPPRGYEKLFPKEKLQEMVAGGEDVKDIVVLGARAIERGRADIRDVQFEVDQHAAEFELWLEEHGGWDYKGTTSKAQEIMDRQRARRAAAEEKANRLKRAITLPEWKTMTSGEQALALGWINSKAELLKQQKDSIEWALWSWNPVTGCEHGCRFYCYARDLAERFYPQGFVPSLVPEALSAPLNAKPPEEAAHNLGLKNIFVCSMADLFGGWVPKEWIEAVLNIIRQAPAWNFLILTKFPQRLAEFEFPENVWVGTTVDLQERVRNAEKALRKVKASVKWLSIEPMIEPIVFDFSLVQWVVIGGSSGSSESPEWKPPRHWVNDLTVRAENAGCQVYHKTNLNLDRLRNYPGAVEPEPVRAPEVYHYLGKADLVNIAGKKSES